MKAPPPHYSFQVDKFLSFKGVVLAWFITWIQSVLKALRDSGLANIIPGLPLPFNGHIRTLMDLTISSAFFSDQLERKITA